MTQKKQKSEQELEFAGIEYLFSQITGKLMKKQLNNGDNLLSDLAE